MEEVWKDIVGFEGYYQVSNAGNVRSVDRIITLKNGVNQKLSGKMIKQHKQNSGYLFVSLYKNGAGKQYLTHRLVATAFIPNPHDYNEVNHIDEDKTNNTADNLEWVTHRVNVVHGTNLRRGVANRDQSGKNNPMYGRKGADNPFSKSVLQLDYDNNIIKRWGGVAEASRELGLNKGNIAGAARGLYKQAGGFKWKYES